MGTVLIIIGGVAAYLGFVWFFAAILGNINSQYNAVIEKEIRERGDHED
jgi:hypothetical protein